MIDLEKISSSNSILDNVISTIVIFAVGYIWRYLRTRLKNSYLFWGVTFVAIIIVALALIILFGWVGLTVIMAILVIIFVSVMIFRESLIWVGGPSFTSKYLREFKKILFRYPENPDSSTSLAYIAKVSAEHLVEAIPKSISEGDSAKTDEKDIFIWIETNREASKYLDELKSNITSSSPGAKPVLAYIAKIAAAHLAEIDIAPNGAIGKDITLSEYIKILSIGIEYKDLVDFTVFNVVSPVDWGDRKATQLNDIQRLAWAYFNKQEIIKEKNEKRIRMRRYLVLSDPEFKKLEEEPESRTLYNAFKEAHREAKIDLWRISPNKLSAEVRASLRDCTFFWNKDYHGCHGWMFTADLDEVLDTGVVKNAYIRTSPAYLKSRCSDLFTQVNQSRDYITDHDSNIMPDHFINELNL